MPSPYRVIAQDIRSGEFLNWHVPLSGIEVKHTLSGPDVISGKLEPELPELNLAAYDAWSTWLHVEQDGQIRASGILQPVSLDEVTIDINAEGPSGYAHGVPWLGEYSGIKVDPLDMVRKLWAHLQSYPDGDLGLKVDSTRSSVKIGTEPKQADFDTSAGEHVSFSTSDGPYQLNWWDHKDCGTEINNLAEQTPFDYRERAEWNEQRTDVLHRLELGYPRLGRQRDDLRFAQGENIVSAIPLAEDDEAYASQVICLGAGEGRDMIRGVASTQNERRLRRVVVISDKASTSVSRAKSKAEAELRRREARVSMDKITVDVTHRNARRGSFDVGDDIAVLGDFPWIGRTVIWHRIVSISDDFEADTAELELSPSATFNYGPPLQES